MGHGSRLGETRETAIVVLLLINMLGFIPTHLMPGSLFRAFFVPEF